MNYKNKTQMTLALKKFANFALSLEEKGGVTHPVTGETVGMPNEFSVMAWGTLVLLNTLDKLGDVDGLLKSMPDNRATVEEQGLWVAKNHTKIRLALEELKRVRGT